MNHPSPLSDGFGRVIQNVRISVTDRCNLRCIYCMPEFPDWIAHREVLTYEELHRLVRVLVDLGVWKVRITGGEPLVRRDLSTLVEKIVHTAGVRKVGLTTNGILLAQQAAGLRAAGLDTVNVSLDSLQRERFRELTRRDDLDAVLTGLEATREAGFSSIKINAVVIGGMNEDEIVPLLDFGRREGYEIRFIEFMPLEADNVWERGKVYPLDQILRDAARHFSFEPADRDPHADPHAPARRFRYRDHDYREGGGTFGIIGSVSHPFCTRCDRVRITADGKLRTCLFSTRETDLKTPLRGGASDEEIVEVIRAAIRGKEPGHFINSEQFQKPERTMHQIGG